MNHADAESAAASRSPGIIGQTASIQALREQIDRLSAFDTVGNPHVPTLLLLGETGTGKGLVARTVHHSGPRAQGPFIDVNCAAIPDNLIEAELFGFEAGAFTDAKSPKAGLFEAASGGVLFLDEIDALPLPLQGTLLKAIEEKRVRRLGSTTDRSVDIKLIAATKEDLTEWVEAGRFRADLYHRLAVVILSLPPLRDRGDDIFVLAQHFLQQYAEAHGIAAKTLSAAAQDWLRTYRWPGNIRELSHVMERVMLLSPDAIVQATTLEQLCQAQPAVAVSLDLAESSQPPQSEADCIRQALIQAGGNIAQAARLLGLTRNTLRYRMRRDGIERPPLDRLEPVEAVDDQPPSQLPADPERSPQEGPEPVWEQKPVAVLAIELTFPQPASPSPQLVEPWTLAAQWERLITDKIQGFGGLCLRHTPSVFLALFGVPQALEQMPQRALQTAFAIQHLANEALSPDTPCPVVRLVLHQGMLLVNLKEAAPMPMALGETFSFPTRLLGHTNAGEIVASSRIHRQLDGLGELHPRKVKLGTDATDWVEAYRVVGMKPTAMKRQFTSVFVGRERELEVLHEQWAEAERGRGQVVGIVGEPGVGKSRLLAEFRQRGGESASYRLSLEGWCQSYGSTVPYLPVLDLLRQCCNILPTDNSANVAVNLDTLLQSIGIELADTAPYLYSLLGLQDQTEAVTTLSADAVKKRTFAALHQVVLVCSQQRPMLIIVEDLQWIDNTSEAFLASLVERLPSVPILLLTTYRPGYRPPWSERSDVTQLALRPLSHAASDRLMEGLLEGAAESLADPERQALIQQADGNPLFLEELVHAMEGFERSQSSGAVPDSIQGVLMARIDQLTPAEKKLLQTASILGREVPLHLLEAIWDGPEPLSALLPELQRQEFIYEQVGLAEPRYLFKHALTQEVVYESLPPTMRQALHITAGQTLEQLYADQLTTVDDWLAYHYARSLDAGKAVEYLSRVAAKAARSYAHVEAVSAYQEALDHVERLPTGKQSRRRLELLLKYAFSLTILGRFRDTYDALLPQQAILEELQDPALTSQYYFRLGATYIYLGPFDQAIEHAHRSLAAAQQCDDLTTRGMTYRLLTWAHNISGDYRQALTYGEEGVSLLKRTTAWHWLGLTYWDIGSSAMHLGEFDRALHAFAQTHAIGTEHDDSRLQHFSESYSAWIDIMRGEWDTGIAAYQRILERSPDPITKWGAITLLGVAYLDQEAPAPAIRYLEQALAQYRQFKFLYIQGRVLAFLAEALLLDNQVERAQIMADQGLEASRDTEHPYGIGLAQRALGRIAWARGENATAEHHLQEALRVFTAIEAQYEVGRTHLVLAEFYHGQNRCDLSAACLIEAYTLFKTLQVPHYMAQAEALAQQFDISLPEIQSR